MIVRRFPLMEAWDDPVTLRNFGLSFSRRSARPDAGETWRPAHWCRRGGADCAPDRAGVAAVSALRPATILLPNQAARDSTGWHGDALVTRFRRENID